MDASALQTLERLFVSESKLDSEQREKLKRISSTW